jgi:putative ABC transport system ATP-binding protein
MDEELVKLEDVKKIYTMDHVRVLALRGVSLTIDRRDFVAIMGPSGSGKSTLMNIIGCLDKPTEGRVIIDGKDVTKLGDNELAEYRRKKIGFIFQQFNLIPRLTAIENVALPMWFAGMNKKKRIRRASILLKNVGLGDRMEHKPTELSGGERQRVAIARALANDPELILADEPTGNLDSRSGDAVLNLLEDLNRRGKTVVIVTHDLSYGQRAKRMINLRDGRLE